MRHATHKSRIATAISSQVGLMNLFRTMLANRNARAAGARKREGRLRFRKRPPF